MRTFIVKMAAGWENVEVKVLLEIRGDEKIPSQLDRIPRNQTIYQKVAASIVELVYDQSWL